MFNANPNDLYDNKAFGEHWNKRFRIRQKIACVHKNNRLKCPPRVYVLFTE